MAKATIAQEVSTGTPESFTEHEMNDPEPHLAILRNRPGLRDEPAKPAPVLSVPPVVAPEEVEETESEIEEFESELESEPEELIDPEEDEEEAPEPEPVKPAAKKATPAKKTAAKRAPQRRTTDDYDFE